MCVYKCWIFELIYLKPFNPLFPSSQGRNPTWGRPARRSRPPRSRSPSCSSRPSGRWRMSSMSLHWSSSSLSELMLSEKRTGNSTCWHKISSMRKFTPKTRDTCPQTDCFGEGLCTGSDIQSEMRKRRESNRLLLTVWLVCTCDWEHNVELQSDPPLTQRSDWWQFCCSRPCLPTGRRARVSSSAASAGCVPSSSWASTRFHSHVKGHWCIGPLPARGQRRPGPTPDWLCHPPTLTKHFHWLCTVWLCLVVF